MDCIQYFESESPSNPKLDNIETESSIKEKIVGTEMSENLYCNYQPPNDKQLDETKMSENQSDYCNSLYWNAIAVTLIFVVKSFHEELKPFTCKLCESTFSRKYAFKLHVKTIHQKLKSFDCFYCKAPFRRLSLQDCII